MNTLPIEAVIFIAVCIMILVVLSIRAILLHSARPREKRADDFMPISPTIQWLNTAGSILIAANDGNFHYMAGHGFPGSKKYQQVFKEMLWEYWGINDHQSSIETMKNLIDYGMRADYKEEMEELQEEYSQFSEKQLIEIEKQTGNVNASEYSYLPKMLMAYRRYGENALLGWDIGRASFILQCCYLVGYISMEEMLDLAVDGGKMAQKVFANWEQMMESYLLGVQYWQNEDAKDPKSMTMERWTLYDKMWNGKKPYKYIPYVTTPFETELSKEVTTDEYGITKEHQKSYEKFKNRK